MNIHRYLDNDRYIKHGEPMICSYLSQTFVIQNKTYFILNITITVWTWFMNPCKNKTNSVSLCAAKQRKQ